ncbi:MAG TPA: SPOR domain-containing protein, partial [Desulfuromonadaceae bacterium]
MHSFPVVFLMAASLASAGQGVAIQKGMSSAGQTACTIQVGAFADENNAVALIRNLKQHGYEAFSVRNGKGLDVVLSGAYPTREKARADGARMMAGHLIKEYIVVPLTRGAASSDRRRSRAEAEVASPGNLPALRKGAGGGAGIARMVQTSHGAAAQVEHAPEAVTMSAPEGGSGHMQANTVVSRGGGTETTLATSRPEESIEQREHGGRVYPAFENSPGPVPAPAAAARVEAPDADRARLASAWKEYNAGRFAAAAALFGSLLPRPEFSLEAGYGLARCHLAGKDFARALPELEHLAKKRYCLHDTLPELLKLLLERHEFRTAADYALLLGERERAVWQGRIAQGVFRQEYGRMRERGGVPEAVAFVKGHESVLKRCGEQDAFKSLAAYLAQKGRPEEAAAIYRTLLACSSDEGVQLGILYALKALVPREELLGLAERKREAAGTSSAGRAKLETLTVDLLHELLVAEPEQVERNAQALLRIQPSDEAALNALGWWYFNKEHYEEAYDCFRKSGSAAAKEGMIYALMKLGRLDEAFTVARLAGGDRRVAALEEEVRLKMLWDRVASLPPDSPEIEALASQILRIRPDNEDIRVVRAWWYYNRDEFAKAYQEFNALYCRNRLGKGYA